jgi:hypothetical protein
MKRNLAEPNLEKTQSLGGPGSGTVLGNGVQLMPSFTGCNGMKTDSSLT